MNSNEIRQKFLKFFESKGHVILPSASLLPVGDSSVLFTTAGMQPLVPYLMGTKHPSGTRLASVQKCVRTGDIEDIGDNRHLTFFEMLGNWSLGDYFKDESIAWSYEFLTSKEKGLGLDPARLYITCFEGDDSAPQDVESKNIWMKAGIPESRIYFLGKDDNWWGPGDNGPCGPDTEIFYDVTGSLGELSHDEFLVAQKSEKVIEIWNNVFMEYKSENGKVVGKLKQKNVDTGMGLERITAVVNGLDNVYDTDLFESIVFEIKEMAINYNQSSIETKQDYLKHIKIISDHIRAAIFMISDGVLVTNNDRGSILKKLLKKSFLSFIYLGIPYDLVENIITKYINKFSNSYNDLEIRRENIIKTIKGEFSSFNFYIPLWERFINKLIYDLSKTGVTPIKVTEKNNKVYIANPLIKIDNYDNIFKLITSNGVPKEFIINRLDKAGFFFDENEFDKYMKEHQNKSRAGVGMFKGGLANHNEATIKLHTAHHLLLAALQEVLGPEVKQRGSNITEERLRIDFSFDRKMTDEEKTKVENIVNDAIKKDYKVVRREMSKDEAEKIGAQMEFGAKYGDTVSVYFIEDESGNAVSKEFCGGPHVEHTGVLGNFKIQKEEASSAGVRRIKGLLS